MQLGEIMSRYCDGDSAAFRDLHAQLAPRLRRYLCRLARDRQVAEDLLQMTFLKVHRARGTYVRGADPVPWIWAIAHRTFLDEARGRRRARVSVAREDLPEVPVTITGTDEQPDDGHTPARVRAALAAISSLPPIHREAVVMTKLDGKSIAEAAAIAGTTRGAMKVRVHRAYQALRQMIEGPALAMGRA